MWCCQTCLLLGGFRRPLIKRKQDVAAGSYKNNESILHFFFFTHRDELKMAAGAGKNPCYVPCVLSLLEHHWGESLWKMCVVWESTSKSGANIFLPKPAVINANSNGYYYYHRHLPVLVLHVADFSQHGQLRCKNYFFFKLCYYPNWLIWLIFTMMQTVKCFMDLIITISNL